MSFSLFWRNARRRPLHVEVGRPWQDGGEASPGVRLAPHTPAYFRPLMQFDVALVRQTSQYSCQFLGVAVGQRPGTEHGAESFWPGLGAWIGWPSSLLADQSTEITLTGQFGTWLQWNQKCPSWLRSKPALLLQFCLQSSLLPCEAWMAKSIGSVSKNAWKLVIGQKWVVANRIWCFCIKQYTKPLRKFPTIFEAQDGGKHGLSSLAWLNMHTNYHYDIFIV